MAACNKCGKPRVRRDKQGRRKCRRCGFLPSGARRLDQGGNPPALHDEEIVHHDDENKHNNDPDNLLVISQGEHMDKRSPRAPSLYAMQTEQPR